MGTTIRAMLQGASSLLDITWSQWTQELMERRNNLQAWVWRHTRWIKKHFDKAYSQVR